MTYTMPHELWLHKVYRITVNAMILIFLIMGVHIFAIEIFEAKKVDDIRS